MSYSDEDDNSTVYYSDFQASRLRQHGPPSLLYQPERAEVFPLGKEQELCTSGPGLSTCEASVATGGEPRKKKRKTKNDEIQELGLGPVNELRQERLSRINLEKRLDETEKRVDKTEKNNEDKNTQSNQTNEPSTSASANTPPGPIMLFVVTKNTPPSPTVPTEPVDLLQNVWQNTSVSPRPEHAVEETLQNFDPKHDKGASLTRQPQDTRECDNITAWKRVPPKEQELCTSGTGPSTCEASVATGGEPRKKKKTKKDEIQRLEARQLELTDIHSGKSKEKKDVVVRVEAFKEELADKFKKCAEDMNNVIQSNQKNEPSTSISVNTPLSPTESLDSSFLNTAMNPTSTGEISDGMLRLLDPEYDTAASSTRQFQDTQVCDKSGLVSRCVGDPAGPTAPAARPPVKRACPMTKEEKKEKEKLRVRNYRNDQNNCIEKLKEDIERLEEDIKKCDSDITFLRGNLSGMKETYNLFELYLAIFVETLTSSHSPDGV